MCVYVFMYRYVLFQHKISHVMHFAGLKAVGESCDKPLMYYKNNLEATMNLIEVSPMIFL